MLAGEGGTGGDEVGGYTFEDDPAAVVAGAGAEVDDPVGVRHDGLVVLDDDDRLAGVDEPVDLLTTSDQAILAQVQTIIERERDVPMGTVRTPVATPG